jgi:hypothetical protein
MSATGFPGTVVAQDISVPVPAGRSITSSDGRPTGAGTEIPQGGKLAGAAAAC